VPFLVGLVIAGAAIGIGEIAGWSDGVGGVGVLVGTAVAVILRGLMHDYSADTERARQAR
jgi:hypothetical protein